MPVCRIYLFTYNRNELLKRAVESLLNQTITNWVCELHNDMPENEFPENYINALNDKRFIIKKHRVNLGTTKSFNLAFGGCEEKYASILEDDNWWEKTFLEEMIGVMDTNADIDISWSNMQIWKESIDNTWHNTNKTIWPVEKSILFTWPQPQQALGALHSTGAMLYKGGKARDYQIPPGSLSNAVELIRERVFKHPIFFNATVLANFSQTLETSQSKNMETWTGTQIMMLASYIKSSDNVKEEFRYLLHFYRGFRPSPIPVFFLANCFYLKRPSLLLTLNVADWIITLRWCAANIFNINRLRKYLKQQGETWRYLIAHTQKFKRDYIIEK
jgi:glycosyltransferase involved in cell wall biosynthesis